MMKDPFINGRLKNLQKKVLESEKLNKSHQMLLKKIE